MATVIDALMVTLGMDVKAFKKGADDAIKVDDTLSTKAKKNSQKRRDLDKKVAREQKKHSQEFKKHTKEGAESVRHLRNQLLGIATIFTGGLGMAMFARNTIDTAANVGRLSSDIGESTTDLLAWQRAQEAVGGSAQGMASALGKANDMVRQLKMGVTDVGPIAGLQTFASLAGGNVNFSKMKKPSDVLMEESRLIKKMVKERGSATAYSLSQQYMGTDQSLFDFLKKGPTAVQGMVNAQKPYAESTARLTKRAQELQAKLSVLKNQFKDIGVTVLTDLMPAFKKAIAAFREFGNWVDSHKTQINQWISSAASDTQKFASAANGVAQALGGWKTVIEGLIALKIAGLVTRLSGLASVLSGIGGSGGLGILGKLGLVGGAGAAGYAAGTWINDTFLNGKNGGDPSIGKALAYIPAIFGDKQAREALHTNVGGSNKPGWRQQHAAQLRKAMNYGMGATSNNVTTHVENIHIHVPSGNPDAIAKGIGPAIKRHSYAPQINSGVK